MTLLIVGKPAVHAALESPNREVVRLRLADSLLPRRRAPFEALAEARRIPVDRVSPGRLTELTGVENHGGVALEAEPRRYINADAFLEGVSQLDHPPLLFALEAFHDPRNLGYALRCVESLGGDGALLSRREWGAEEAILAHASAGAFDRLPLAPLEDSATLLRRLETLGVDAVGATSGATRSVYDFDLRAPVLIAVGGEFKGLSDTMRKACRHTAHLPMTDSVQSFPASHAAAILAAEAARQRRAGGRPGPLWRR